MTKQEVTDWLARCKRVMAYESEWDDTDDKAVEAILAMIPDDAPVQSGAKE